MSNRYLLLGLPGALFWVLTLIVVGGDLGRHAAPLGIPGVALFVAALLCGGVAMLRKAPARRRVAVVVVSWSTVVAWLPFFAYLVRSGA